MLIVLFTHSPFAHFNLYIQSIGFYIQNLISFGLHCDALERLGTSYGAEDRNRYIPRNIMSPEGRKFYLDGPGNWMDRWTLFFWGWWISWAPFIGLFFAKISRGRTVREFMHGTITAPVCYIFLWLVVFSGAAIRMERQAAKANLCCSSPKLGFFRNLTELKISAGEYGLQPSDRLSSVKDHSLCVGECNKCAKATFRRYSRAKKTFKEFLQDYHDQRESFGSKGLGDQEHGITRLSCRREEEVIFDIVLAVPILGKFLVSITFIGIFLYFITSADAGCLVIGHMTANGARQTPLVQRLFWLAMEGAVATVLLYANKEEDEAAFWSVGSVTGVPYTILISLLCSSLWKTLLTVNDKRNTVIKFKMGLFDPFGALPDGTPTEPEVPAASVLFRLWAINVFLGPYTMGRICSRIYKRLHPFTYSILFFSCEIFFVIFQILGLINRGINVVAWVYFVTFAFIIAVVRKKVRSEFRIEGNMVEDLFASMLYPNAILQMDVETQSMAEVANPRLTRSVQSQKLTKSDAKILSKKGFTSERLREMRMSPEETEELAEDLKRKEEAGYDEEEERASRERHLKKEKEEVVRKEKELRRERLATKVQKEQLAEEKDRLKKEQGEIERAKEERAASPQVYDYAARSR